MPPEDDNQPAGFNPYAPPAGGADDHGEPTAPSGHAALRDRLASEQLGLGSLFTVGWRIYLANLKTILLCGAVVYIPTNLLLAALPGVQNKDYVTQLTYYARVANLINMLVGVVAVMAVMSVVKQHLEGQRIDFGQAMLMSVRRWGHAIGTNIMAGLWLLLMFLCLVVPGIIYSIYYIFVVPAVILGNLSGMRALSYSKSLVVERWWPTLGFALVIAMTYMGLLTTLGVVPGVLVGLTGQEHPLLDAAVNALGDTLGTYFTVMEAVWFLNRHRMLQIEEQILASTLEGPGLPAEPAATEEQYPPLDWPPKS
jgi:uncharacterized membrane protein